MHSDKAADPYDFMPHEHRKEMSLEEYMEANFGTG